MNTKLNNRAQRRKNTNTRGTDKYVSKLTEQHISILEFSKEDIIKQIAYDTKKIDKQAQRLSVSADKKLKFLVNMNINQISENRRTHWLLLHEPNSKTYANNSRYLKNNIFQNNEIDNYLKRYIELKQTNSGNKEYILLNNDISKYFYYILKYIVHKSCSPIIKEEANNFNGQQLSIIQSICSNSNFIYIFMEELLYDLDKIDSYKGNDINWD